MNSLIVGGDKRKTSLEPVAEDSDFNFKLLDRAVVRELAGLAERRRFFRGLVAWLGYPSARLPFDVPERAGGGSRWSGRRLAAYALDAVMGFSDLPLRLIGVTLRISLARLPRIW